MTWALGSIRAQKVCSFLCSNESPQWYRGDFPWKVGQVPGILQLPMVGTQVAASAGGQRKGQREWQGMTQGQRG